MAVAEQALQCGQVHAGLQQVRGEGVSQRMNATFAGNAGGVAPGAVHALCHFDAHRAVAGGIGKQPRAWPAIAPVQAQRLEQSGREERVAILGALALAHLDAHAIGGALDVVHLQPAQLRDAQAGSGDIPRDQGSEISAIRENETIQAPKAKTNKLPDSRPPRQRFSSTGKRRSGL